MRKQETFLTLQIPAFAGKAGSGFLLLFPYMPFKPCLMEALKPKTPETASPLDHLQHMLGPDMDSVNAIILERMQSSVPLIPQLATYLIAAGGKRIRPLLTLAATSLFDGEMTRAHKLAAAVEFIHTATLLHDDVVDDSDERRGQQSANIVFGNEASVLVGDFLFSRAFQLMTEDGSLDVLRILSGASAIIAEGEVLQLTTQNNLDTSLEEYIKVIEGKTASLFAAACEVGPVIADQPAETVKALHDYGMNLGIAFQIADDVLDYSAEREKLGKAVGDDFREGKMTAPVILALQKADDEEHAFWTRTIADRHQSENDLKTAQSYLEKHGALNKGLDLAHSYGGKALEALNILPETDLKTVLSDLITYSITRQA